MDNGQSPSMFPYIGMPNMTTIAVQRVREAVIPSTSLVKLKEMYYIGQGYSISRRTRMDELDRDDKDCLEEQVDT